MRLAFALSVLCLAATPLAHANPDAPAPLRLAAVNGAGLVALNPQPLPPVDSPAAIRNPSTVMLNPQPLPPGCGANCGVGSLPQTRLTLPAARIRR